jgi:hypothetical protein
VRVTPSFATAATFATRFPASRRPGFARARRCRRNGGRLSGRRGGRRPKPMQHLRQPRMRVMRLGRRFHRLRRHDRRRL